MDLARLQTQDRKAGLTGRTCSAGAQCARFPIKQSRILTAADRNCIESTLMTGQSHVIPQW
jgi:hypothetical protein